MNPGWQGDPSGRHQERYHDGDQWSPRVRDYGVENQDDAGAKLLGVEVASPPAAAGAPPATPLVGPPAFGRPTPARPIVGPPGSPSPASFVSPTTSVPPITGMVPVVPRITAGSTSPAGMPPVGTTPPPARSPSSRRAASGSGPAAADAPATSKVAYWAVLLSTALLGAALALPPIIRITYGKVPLWDFSYVRTTYLYVDIGSKLHHYPAWFWWSVAACAGGAIAVAGAILILATRGRLGAGTLILGGIVAGASAIIAVEITDSYSAPGVGAWGTLLAGGTTVLAGWAVASGRRSGPDTERTLAVLSLIVVIALGVAAIPALHSKDGSTYDASSSYSPTTYDSSYETTEEDPYDTTEAPTYETTTEPETTSAGDLVNTYSVSSGSDGGYTYEGTVALGRPEHFRTGLTNGQLTAGSACSISEQTDAVIPGRITMRSTTENFDTRPGIALSWASYEISSLEANFSSGPSCENDGLSVSSTDSVADGGGFSVDFFLIVADYYSPDDPSGDEESLKNITLNVVTDTPDDGEAIVPKSVSGPGVEPNSLAIPLDPGS